MRVFRILQECAGLACPFGGLCWQCSCADTRLELSLGTQTGRGKGRRKECESTVCCIYGPDHSVFRTFLFTAPASVITSYKMLHLLKPFLALISLTFAQQFWQSCGFPFFTFSSLYVAAGVTCKPTAGYWEKAGMLNPSKPPWWFCTDLAKNAYHEETDSSKTCATVQRVNYGDISLLTCQNLCSPNTWKWGIKYKCFL